MFLRLSETIVAFSTLVPTIVKLEKPKKEKENGLKKQSRVCISDEVSDVQWLHINHCLILEFLPETI